VLKQAETRGKMPHSRGNFMKDLAYMETTWQFWGGQMAIYPRGLSIDEPSSNKKSILRLYPTRPEAQERHHLPNPEEPGYYYTMF
jgi:hypothetical protein